MAIEETVRFLADGTMKAAILILEHRGTDVKNLDDATIDRLCAAMRAVLSERLPAIMDEWREATDAHISEGWLKQLVNAQCNEAALEAVSRVSI